MHTFSVIHKERVQEVVFSILSRKKFHFWRLRTLGAIILVITFLIGSVVYSVQVTDYAVLFSTREKIVNNIENAKATEEKDKKLRSELVLAANTNMQKEILHNSFEFYKNNFTLNSTQSIDPVRDYKTTSEGQSYLLLRAAIQDDKSTFLKSWKWTKENMQRKDDYLFYWLYGEKNGRDKVIDAKNAVDADEDIALALIIAGYKWNNLAYLNEATQIVNDLWEKNVVLINGKYYLLAGSHFKNSKGYVINPSYLSPASYKLFAVLDPKHEWLKLSEDVYSLLIEIHSQDLGNVGLVPNWIFINKKGEIGSASQYIKEDPDMYSFSAFRTYWRVALDALWFQEKEAKNYLQLINPFFTYEWNRKKSFGSIYSLAGEDVSDYSSLSTNVGPLAVFSITNKNLAKEIYEELFQSKMNSNKEFWGNGKDYYEQNWAWFGTALYTNNLNIPEGMKK